ncbi:MAG: hypothetical protein AB8W78_06010 [Arsenophonus endosymbiont of Dermacentor nuttalli]
MICGLLLGLKVIPYFRSGWDHSLPNRYERKLSKSYPFLEIMGKPGSGKSTLIEFFGA